MKKKTLFGAALLVSAAIAVPVLAFGADGDKDAKSVEERCRGRMEKKIARFDQDGDGKLSQDERKAMHEEREARRLAHFDEMDTNDDGMISREEFAAAKPKHRGHGRRGR
jgi:hypothetical protein